MNKLKTASLQFGLDHNRNERHTTVSQQVSANGEDWLDNNAYGGSDILRLQKNAFQSIGKRVRSIICDATASMFDVAPNQVTPYCIALEFIHVASCIIDDLPSIDDTSMREDGPTFHKRSGEGPTILAAFGLTADAIKIGSSFPKGNIMPQQQNAIVELLADTIKRMTSGELQDISAGNGSSSSYLIDKCVIDKTAALFEASLQIPAIIAGIDLEEKQYLKEFGKNLGISYQLADELEELTIRDIESQKILLRLLSISINKSHSFLRMIKRDTNYLRESSLDILEFKSGYELRGFLESLN